MAAAVNPAIAYETRGFDPGGGAIVGLQSANGSFLRAAVAYREENELWCFTRSRSAAEDFEARTKRLDRRVETVWCHAARPDMLSKPGLLYLAEPTVAAAARLRLRVGASSYSLCGITHTMASDVAMAAAADLLTAPVMPWDALICTSKSIAKSVDAVLEAEFDYLRWRFGADLRRTLPELPIIPLGVHCEDFNSVTDRRPMARKALGLEDGRLACLYVGRLSHTSKSHPLPMYRALQEVAEATGLGLTLIQCGWFEADSEAAFADAAAMACPDVKIVNVDGRNADARDRCWAAADLFMSLADNFQESFGLTPVEAMAAGLPVIISDWNGYRDTVRDGVDGFRIQTWAPGGGQGEPFGRAYEVGQLSSNQYFAVTAQTVSLNLRDLVQRLTMLAENGDLRARMGESGRRRAQELFDWSAVYRQYRDLWDELGRRRRRAQADDTGSAPLSSARALDPFAAFSSYPSEMIGPATVVTLVGSDTSDWQVLRSHALFRPAQGLFPSQETLDRLFAVLRSGPHKLEAISSKIDLGLSETIIAVAAMAKMGCLTLKVGDRRDPYSR